MFKELFCFLFLCSQKLMHAFSYLLLVGADCSVRWSSRSAGKRLPAHPILIPLLAGGLPWASWSGSEGWPPHGSLLNPGERTASHVRTAEGWLMAKWPSRWTSTAPTPRRPSRITTSTRAASNLHTSTCKSTRELAVRLLLFYLVVHRSDFFSSPDTNAWTSCICRYPIAIWYCCWINQLSTFRLLPFLKRLKAWNFTN